MLKEEIWSKALEVLQKNVSTISYDLWIKSLEPVDIKNGVFYLSTTSETAKQRIMTIHKGDIYVAITSITDEVKDFAVLDPDERDAYMKNAEIAVKTESQRFPGMNTFNKKYKFENFIVGNSNKYVYFACKGVAENPSAKINPLFIYGGSGLGKTHLLNAIGNSLNELHPELRTLYCTCEKFTGDYVKSLQGNYNAKNNFKEKYRNLDVLIIDDIQFISKAESTQEEFFFTFNELYESGKQIIIASDRPPKEISTLQERLASRFSMGLIQDIQFPDYETRLAILMKKAQEEGFVVEDQVLEYLAEHFDTNIREMEGVLMKVWYYASLIGKKSASMDDAREALKDHDFSNKQNLTAERIIDCVCKYYNVKKDDLLGKKKNKDIVEPRQICMYVICSMLEMSLLSIGQLFGRDHTTVIHARDKVTTAIEENQRVKIAVNDIKAMATKN